MCLFAECVYGWNLLFYKILCVRFAFPSLLFLIHSSLAKHQFTACWQFAGCTSAFHWLFPHRGGTGSGGSSSCVSSANNREKRIKNELIFSSERFSQLTKNRSISDFLRCRPASACAVLLLSTPPIRSAVIQISVSRLHIHFLSFQVSVAHAVTQCSSRTAGAMYVRSASFTD